MASIGLEAGILEHLLVSLRTDAHILLAQAVDMSVDVVGCLR